MTYFSMPCCLFYCHLPSQLDLKPLNQVITFWFFSPCKGYTLDSGQTTDHVKKNPESMPAAPIPSQNQD